jgi:hypothetical protein
MAAWFFQSCTSCKSCLINFHSAEDGMMDDELTEKNQF